MNNEFNFEIEPFKFQPEFENPTFEEFDTELAGQEWEGEFGRRRLLPAQSTRYRQAALGSRQLPARRPLPPRRPGWPPTVVYEPAGVEPAPEPAGSEYGRWVQNTLNQVMNLRLPVDGVIGPETRSAIRSFQRRKGLPVDGIVGPRTEAALIAAGGVQPAQSQSAAPESEAEWLEEVNRSSRDYIKWVQRSLNQIMGLRLAVDGISGTQTRSAVRSFQQQRGLLVDGIVGPQTEAALKAALAGGYAPSPPQPRPQPPSRGAYAPGASLRQNIVRVAQGEFARWNFGQIQESDPSMRAVLEDYWRATPVGVPTTANWWSNVPWSAAFISWVMKNAGAGSNFQYSNAHTDYVGAAKRNRLANNSNPFKAYRITEIAPRPGDLVCVERQDDQGNWSGVNYDNVDQGFRASHCDVVVEVQPGKLITIGGNVSNSVSDTPVQIDSTGRVIQSRYYAVVRVGV